MAVAPMRIVTTHSGMTTWVRPGARRTAGGAWSLIQWMRWSCQRATGAEETLRHSGGADGSALPGTRVAPRRLTLR